MANALRFHPSVADDLSEAIAWYEDRSLGLGDRFRSAVNNRLDAILENPQRFGFAFPGLRFARLFKFPYVVIFRTYEEFVEIVGVFHAASDPKKWRRGS